MRTRHDQRVAPPQLADVGQIKPHLQRQPRPRVRFNLVVHAHAVLMPRHAPILPPRALIRRHVQVRMVKINVPAENAPHLRERRRPINQVHQRRVFVNHIRHRQQLPRQRLRPLPRIHSVHHLHQPRRRRSIQCILDDKEAVRVKKLALVFRQNIFCATRIHGHGSNRWDLGVSGSPYATGAAINTKIKGKSFIK